ncbi:hypothetical protein [Nucisporomicrobium flavum]|uniref:hypothetical protein n=1 Tax=Nucisporomicrobium flavum TaxID=2785915 RepID=UPI0018F29D96|nr:hypothetical protein [Nucisporomicrobium flavum]
MNVHRLVLSAVLLTGAAACSDDSGNTPSASGGTTAPATSSSPAAEPSVPPSAPAGTAPSCVTGRWRATGVASTGDLGDVRGRIAGGTGTVLTVGDDGRTEVDFKASRPLTFTAEAAGADVRGQVAYKGSFRGAVAFQGDNGTGRWDPQGKISWSDLSATVRLDKPFDVTLLDDVSLADIDRDALPGASGAVDVQPILRGGTYECQGETLRLRTRANGPDLTWTFARASR